MADRDFDLLPLLDYIEPASLTYQEWVDVGMALKHEGYSAADWDLWSQSDSRYKEGECFKKWDSFQREGLGSITGATITQMAKERGWTPKGNSNGSSHELDWDSTIGDYQIVDKNWVESQEIREPFHWEPGRELLRYLETLFESTDYVGYVTETYLIETDKGPIYKPTKGAYDRTAGELIQALQGHGNDIGAVFGDPKEEAGAWIRFNPVDGKGVKNDNVTEFRYALVESDSMELGKQYALFKELELPIATLVHSGKKSLHAIVKVDARDPDALIDLVELELTDELIKMRTNKATAKVYQEALQEQALAYYQQHVSLDDLESRAEMQKHFEKAISDILVKKPYLDKIQEVRRATETSTGWRVEGTLREFAKFPPVNMWFSYPVHSVDQSGVLADIQVEDSTNGKNSPWKKNFEKKKSSQERKQDRSERIEIARSSLNDGINPVSLDDLVGYFSTEDKPVSEKTIRRWVKDSGRYEVKNKQVCEIIT
ncbi:PriCT-2 domain-containing protein [Streptococcus danieliae]|nr:PriCT-2 domain-containing protein [Streptococcus danieliae]